ncbi:thioesterase family protein [Actinomadura kijaniata]|uniref:thioesterase family protein n=1 Tax=Actinomadura kijaniata TaxID=46161 RepID=UPI003F19D046
MEIGLRGVVSAVVGEADTARALGSGDVPVLGTPRLVALAEAATVEALAGRLGEGRTSVGTRVEVEHRAASAVGTRLTVTAEVVEVDGRRVVFSVSGVDEQGVDVGGGRVERVIVERERFLRGLG